MQNNTLINGSNFSGRSDRLKQMLSQSDMMQRSVYIGPYGEAALSGFATYISEEVYIYHGSNPERQNIDFYPDNLRARGTQRVSALSGGEQVLLALYCFAGSRFRAVGIDTALEQLDPTNRTKVLSYISNLPTEDRFFVLIDNRIEDDIRTSANNISLPKSNLFTLDIKEFKELIPSQSAPTIEIRNLDFSYDLSTRIFESASTVLEGGTGYRLRGDNGTGKSTFLKILTGVLPSRAETIFIDDYPYQPNKDGNLLIALSMQNPDDQWAGISIQKDIECKLKALRKRLSCQRVINYDILEGIQYFGLSKDPEYHLLDLPKALRKRLSWLWPLGGYLPWIALDEPTIGQDQDAVHQLANVLNDLVHKGYGLIFITHNENFAKMIHHKELLFRERRIHEFK